MQLTCLFPSKWKHASKSKVSLNIYKTKIIQCVYRQCEFHKTALNTCRSTITQQEVELKRLKESQNIRNKRIVQFEAHIGNASDLFGTRNTSKDSFDGVNSYLCDSYLCDIFSFGVELSVILYRTRLLRDKLLKNMLPLKYIWFH